MTKDVDSLKVAVKRLLDYVPLSEDNEDDNDVLDTMSVKESIVSVCTELKD